MRHPELASVFLVLGACAAPQRIAVGTHATCSVPSVTWAAAQDDFNRKLTLEMLGALESVLKSDRQTWRTPGRALGGSLASLGHGAESRGFVSLETAELATRLRQLDCAVLEGLFNARPNEADQRYGQILADLAQHRQAISTKKGS
jgi:hypothetical protein